jgi:hypothetical protein
MRLSIVAKLKPLKLLPKVLASSDLRWLGSVDDKMDGLGDDDVDDKDGECECSNSMAFEWDS